MEKGTYVFSSFSVADVLREETFRIKISFANRTFRDKNNNNNKADSFLRLHFNVYFGCFHNVDGLSIFFR